MNRLLSSLRWETVIQLRQGIYYAALFVVIVWGAILYQIPAAGIEPILISVLFLDLSIFGFFFMAGLYYLEKGDRVLEGLVVTPLRVWEYLTVKVVTLSLLSIVVGAMVTVIVYGLALNWLWYVVGVGMMSVPLSLFGFAIATRYDGISEFLVPSIFFLGLMQIPLLGYFGIWDNPVLYLIPSQPGMILLAAAFEPIPAWEIGYAVVYALVLIVVSYRWASRMFENTVARRAGG